ncbi:ankyrin [Achlya hypogyna]|uniref:Ankyrin n=1 Tax=Achlya hypogyna TaxID=1202772 RepID=A0A1V9YL56_ACHHY|nr:ankyrin [Achlya hypogyna]
MLLAANVNGACPAIILAACNSSVPILRLLIEAGADVDASWVAYEVHLASMFQPLTFVQAIYMPPLLAAAARLKEGTEMIAALLEAGANVNYLANAGHSALPMAAKQGYAETVKMLLGAGAQVNVTDTYGRQPLYFAARQGHTDIVSLLLEAGADVDKCGDVWEKASRTRRLASDGQTPVVIAASNGHEAVVRRLLEAGADIERRAEDGRSALHAATKCGHTHIVQLLLESNAYIDRTKASCKGPLASAIEQDNQAIVLMLCKAITERASRDALAAPMAIPVNVSDDSGDQPTASIDWLDVSVAV